MDSKLEILWRIYATINEWIKFSDTKAAVILGTDGVIAGIILTNFVTIRSMLYKYPGFYILFSAGALAILLSVYFTVRCLNPTLDVGEADSLIYFAHISKKFKTSHEYSKEVNKIFNEDSKIEEQINDQIWANSKVAWKKYTAVVWATRLSFILALLIIITVVIVVFIKPES